MMKEVTMRKRTDGFTLVELMVVIAIASVLMMVAVPSFNAVALNMRLTSYANSLVASTHLARGEAIKRNADVSLCVSDNGATCTDGGWELGYLVMCPSDDGVACEAGAEGTLVLQKQEAAAPGFRINESNGLAKVDFKSTGLGATAAEFTLCRKTPTVGYRERVVRVSPTGRPSVTKTETEVCN
jgi:type IV fimbrial biogenesis protein FimT